MPKRRKARVLALQIIFQLQSRGDDFLDQMDGFVQEAEFESSISDYGRELALQAWNDRANTDAIIDKFARDWTATSLPAVDLAILRLAIYEMLHRPDVPPKVAIDEAIEMAKVYSTESSSRFINGLLDSVMKADPAESENAISENQATE